MARGGGAALPLALFTQQRLVKPGNEGMWKLEILLRISLKANLMHLLLPA